MAPSGGPAVFPFVRTTLLLASGLALIGFLVYPTAPPRLAGIGLVDTVSSGRVDLNYGLVSSLYNPDAAVPSMHIGYAFVVGASLLRCARSHLAYLAGALYPLFVLLVVVAHRQPLLLRCRHRRDHGRPRRRIDAPHHPAVDARPTSATSRAAADAM